MSNARTICLVCVMMAVGSVALADTFAGGTANAFNIDFVPISGDAGNLGSWSAGSGYTFSGVNHGDYRMGTYEITNDQWNKFKAAYNGAVAGNPTTAYAEDPSFTGSSVPTTGASWYEAAQFVNFLNTSTGHTAAYNFTGEIHTSTYTLGVWGADDADGSNLYRNKNAKYFLPTENEWVKAAYWNGTMLQTYATKAGETLTQGNGTGGTGWNYYTTQYATNPAGPWNVGSGSLELNNTYDMMGNVWEWMESPDVNGDYRSDSERGRRGASYHWADGERLASSYRRTDNPGYEIYDVGFRVASVPEPASLLLLSLGGLALRYRKR